ncbi:MAG: hypothetical protein WCC92_11345 [Candidatus Korobacteraceae bacterium]
MTEKIGQLEFHVAQRLESLLRNLLQDSGYSVPVQDQLRVKLYKGDRKTRSDASTDYWSPKSGWIQLYFEPKPLRGDTGTTTADSLERQQVPGSSSLPGSASASKSAQRIYVHPAEADLLRALDRAESTPGWSFVPLKKFRDEILPSERHVSMRTDVEQQHMLRSAIEKRLILVGKVPNPKSPQFPVTTIRLNRLLPEVQAVLGGGENVDLDFHPVEIRGEPLSATVLRERR